MQGLVRRNRSRRVFLLAAYPRSYRGRTAGCRIMLYSTDMGTLSFTSFMVGCGESDSHNGGGADGACVWCLVSGVLSGVRRTGDRQKSLPA